MQKNKIPIPLFVAALIAGAGVGITGLVSAQTTTTATSVTPATTTNTNAPPGRELGRRGHKHAPLGRDGIVTSVTGTTIVMSEEANEGGASYTIDASAALFTKNGVVATLADIKVGDKIFIDGSTSGSTVVASKISVGRPSRHGPRHNNDPKDTPRPGEAPDEAPTFGQ